MRIKVNKIRMTGGGLPLSSITRVIIETDSILEVEECVFQDSEAKCILTMKSGDMFFITTDFDEFYNLIKGKCYE